MAMKIPEGYDRQQSALRKLHASIETIEARAVLNGHRKYHLSEDQLVKLSNMWHERAEDILRRIASGESFSAADKHSQGIYDTCYWGEICSRLARGGGALFASASRLARQGRRIVGIEEAVEQLLQISKAIELGVLKLADLLEQVPYHGTSARPIASKKGARSWFDAAAPVTLAKVNGQLTQCRVFVAKCVRDVPLVVGKTGRRPSAQERAKIKAHAGRIIVGARLVSFMCANDLVGTVTKPGRTSNAGCIDVRYAPWLAPVLAQMLRLETW